MELKHNIISIKTINNVLLIVPYGIETQESEILFASGTLLIVPYGIETGYVRNIAQILHYLLIVPYGIETTDRR